MQDTACLPACLPVVLFLLPALSLKTQEEGRKELEDMSGVVPDENKNNEERVDQRTAISQD